MKLDFAINDDSFDDNIDNSFPAQSIKTIKVEISNRNVETTHGSHSIWKEKNSGIILLSTPEKLQREAVSHAFLIATKDQKLAFPCCSCL